MHPRFTCALVILALGVFAPAAALAQGPTDPFAVSPGLPEWIGQGWGSSRAAAEPASLSTRYDSSFDYDAGRELFGTNSSGFEAQLGVGNEGDANYLLTAVTYRTVFGTESGLAFVVRGGLMSVTTGQGSDPFTFGDFRSKNLGLGFLVAPAVEYLMPLGEELGLRFTAGVDFGLAFAVDPPTGADSLDYQYSSFHAGADFVYAGPSTVFYTGVLYRATSMEQTLEGTIFGIPFKLTGSAEPGRLGLRVGLMATEGGAAGPGIEFEYGGLEGDNQYFMLRLASGGIF